jgi:hypothetical protein
MRFVAPQRLADLVPNVAFKPKPPFVAALELFVADTAQTQSCLAGRGVPHRIADGGAIAVPPEQACGVVVRFVRGG